MPVKNRDDERLYPKSSLAMWMAVSSAILVLCVGLMLWKDWARPWKRYQQQFRDKQVEVAKDLLEQAKKATDGAAIKELEIALEGARDEKTGDFVPGKEGVREQVKREHKARLAQIAERRTELGRQAKATDIEMKKAKGQLTEAKYYVEQALAHLNEGRGSQEEVDRRLTIANRFGTELDNANIRLSNVQSEDTALMAEADAINAPIRKAEEALQKARADMDKKRMTLDGLTQRYAKNPWRNGLIIDFINPSLKIDQVVLKDIHDNYNIATNDKVDRCMTCHLGADIPDFGTPAIVEKHKIPRWMQAHPALALITGSNSPHPKDRAGCTVCHAGVGWSTDFSRSTHYPQTPEVKAEWEEQHDWKPPQFVDFPMLPSQYVEGQCFKCHKEGLYVPPHYLERLDHGFAFQRDKLGNVTFFQKGPDGKPLGYLEAYGEYSLPPAPPAVAGSSQEIAARTESYYSGTYKPEGSEETLDPGNFRKYEELDKTYKVHSYGWEADRFQRGYDTMTAYGCQGCHTIQDFGKQVGYDAPPRVAPDLRHVGDKVTAEWLERWIRAPETFRIDTPMPAFFYFVPKDRDWVGKRDAAGRLLTVPTMDSYLTDPGMAGKLEGQQNSTPWDLARLDVEILAMKTALLSMSTSRGDPASPDFHPLYAKDPLPGDKAHGREVVGSYGCAACHILPEVSVNGEWKPDDGARFGGNMLIGAGSLRAPRLTSLGSKLKDRRWLNAWLENPRHYSADTRMPDMRFKDELDATGKVVRTAEQVRADVVDYLLSFKDAEFESIPDTTLATADHLKILAEEYEEFYGKGAGGTLLRKRDIEGHLGDLGDKQKLAGVLRDVGERLLTQYGCFGCHLVTGHERDQPIGTELTSEGVKDLHMLDFGRLAHGTEHDVVPHTRWDFIRTKITYPRIWEVGRVVRWTDRLRMPRFNFRMDDGDPVSTRASVAGMVLGFTVEPQNPIKDRALFHPDEYQKDIIAGRRIVRRYGCNNCHTLEGKEGILAGWLTSPALGSSHIDAAFAPPNLFGEGARVRSDWLMKFLTKPFDLRPQVVPHMPRFGFKPEEAAALAAYFDRLAGDRVRFEIQPDSNVSKVPYADPLSLKVKDADGNEREVVVRDAVSEAEALFNVIGCNTCHLPKGSPGASPTDGGVAPSFELAAARLQQDWVQTLLRDPQHLISGTKMVQFWTGRAKGKTGLYGRTVKDAYQPFLLDLRSDAAFMADWSSSDKAKHDAAMSRLANRQMDALADFLVHHYRPPVAAPAEAPR